MANEQDIQTLATDYLARNTRLQETLGIPANTILVPHPLGMGEHNLNYWFENPISHDKHVLRINVTKQPFHDDQVRYEFTALELLESSRCTPKPLYLDDSPDAPCEGAMVIGFCEGEQLDFDDLLPDDLDRAAKIMAGVHSVPVPRNCPLYRPKNPIRKLFDECLDRYSLYERSGFADPEVIGRMDRFAHLTASAVDAYEFDPKQAHIVNTETLASHFLLPKDRRSRQALSETDDNIIDAPGCFVDWERPIIGDVAEDVAFFVAPTTTFWDSDRLFPTEQIDGFVDLYWKAVCDRFVRGNFDSRFAAFLKVAIFRALTWCCRAVVQQKSGAKIHMTDKAKAKVPIYLSEEFMDDLLQECFR